MRFAVLADIHGNPFALDAVLADIETAGGVDELWVVGDLVALGPDPNGVLDRLHARSDTRVVRGNSDRYTTTDARPLPTMDEAISDPELFARFRQVEAGFSWTRGAITVAGYFDWVHDLPLEHRAMLPDGTRVLAVHASVGHDDGGGIYPGQPEREVRELLSGADADLVFVGHTHGVVDRVVDGVRVVNPGSVSNHIDRDVTAKYALVEASEASTVVTLRRVAYDNQLVIDALERVRHPGRDFISAFLRGDGYAGWRDRVEATA